MAGSADCDPWETELVSLRERVHNLEKLLEWHHHVAKIMRLVREVTRLKIPGHSARMVSDGDKLTEAAIEIQQSLLGFTRGRSYVLRGVLAELGDLDARARSWAKKSLDSYRAHAIGCLGTADGLLSSLEDSSSESAGTLTKAASRAAYEEGGSEEGLEAELRESGDELGDGLFCS